ncbi:MAG: transporter substrate-binding domain-containing protein [Clostridia bacterium]|nr:transporter substrate-binding domain-containing protein [Clostridia bacterium]
MTKRIPSAQRRKNLHRMTALLLGLMLMISLIPLQAMAETTKPKVVRLGYVNSAGYEEGLAGEPKSGFGYEYFQKISYFTGWEYQYVYGSFSTLIDMLARGEIDILGDVSYIPERAETMLFSSYPMGGEKLFLFAAGDNTVYSGANPASMNGARIGYEPNKSTWQTAREWVEKFGLDVSWVPCESFDEVQEKMSVGQIDLMIMTDTAESFGYMPVQLVGTQDIFFAVAKDRPDLLEELNNALGVIQGNTPNYNVIVHDTYLPATVGTRYLGSMEKEWLAAHNNTIVLGYLIHNLPFSDMDDEGRPTGYIASVIREMEETHGIHVVTRGFDDMHRMYDAAAAGEVDVFGPAPSTFYLSEQYNAMQSTAIIDTNLVLVFKDDVPKTDRIAVTNSSMVFDSTIKAYYPESTQVVCENLEGCISALMDGRADCLAIPAAQMNQVRAFRAIRELNFRDTPTELHISLFAMKGNPGLLMILDKCISRAAGNLQGVEFMVNTYLPTERSAWDFILDHFAIIFSVALIGFVFMTLCLLLTWHSRQNVLRLNL